MRNARGLPNYGMILPIHIDEPVDLIDSAEPVILEDNGRRMKSHNSGAVWKQRFPRLLFWSAAGALFMFFLLQNYALAAEPGENVLVFEPNQTEYLLGTYLDYLEDPDGTLSLEQVRSPEYAARFTPGGKAILNFGLTNSTYWLRLPVRNAAPAGLRWRLELARPTMNTVIIYRPRPDGFGYTAHQTGYVYPFASREVIHESFVFELPIPSGSEQVIYLSVKDKSMELPLRIYEKGALQQRDLTIYLLTGLSFGGLIIMLVYNFFMTIILREKSFTYYTLFQVALLLHFGNALAYTQRYLWPNQPYINTFIVPLTIELVLISLTLFAGAFFQIQRQVRAWQWGYNAILVILIVSVIPTPFIKVQVLDLVLPMVVATVVFIFLLALWTWLHGFKPARFYLTSWSIFLLIALISVLESMGVLTISQVLPELLLQFGAVYVVAFQSLALADRFNLYRQELLNSQSALLAKQEESLKLKDELTRSLEFSRHELEQKVSERTQTLHELNLELASEIENRKLAQQEAEILARTDPLTGLYNRRYFSRLEEYEFSKARRYGLRLSMYILDIDHFKDVNDTFGHPVGDQALAHLAQILQSESRSVDILARYGGEEFVALLPETGLEEARAAAERLREIIEQTSLELDGKIVRMTVSIGVAGMNTGRDVDQTTGSPAEAEPSSSGDIENFDDLLKQADEALYQAKYSGRNQVVVFSGSQNARSA